MVHSFGSEFFQWEIAWALDWGCSDGGNEPKHLFTNKLQIYFCNVIIYRPDSYPMLYSFELQQWRIAWFFSPMILQSDLQFGALANDLIIDSGNIYFDLTFASTRYACVKEFHPESPITKTNGTFLAKVVAAVPKILCQFPLHVKTYSFNRVICGQAHYWCECSISDDLSENHN